MKLLLVVHKYGVPIDDPCCYPIGFMYISSVLKKARHEVKVLNYNLFDYDFEEEIKGKDAVLFTGFEEFLPYIRKDSEICRKFGIKTIVGGALATFNPAMMADICDTVVVGEGESVICEALGKKGIIEGGISSLKLPYPDYDGFGIEEYKKRHRIKHIGVLTSRGCPFSCTFCAHTCQFKMRKLGDVFEEIDFYNYKYGIRHIVFNDNTINVQKNRFLDLCDGMRYRKSNWSAALRLDVFDEEMCKAMADSYCHNIIVGVESFSQKTLDEMNKKLKVEQIYKGLDLLHKYKIQYYGNVLFGVDGQTDEQIEKDYNEVPTQYNLFPSLIRPFIGTKQGRKSELSIEEREKWNSIFNSYAVSKGMNVYPEPA